MTLESSKQETPSWHTRMSVAAHTENMERILDILEPDPCARVLDVGCADGWKTSMVHERIGGESVIGTDIDSSALALTRDRPVQTVRADCEHTFPFDDGSFDVVIANQIIEHVRGSDHFLDEVRRILKDDGYAVISTMNLASPHNSLLLLLGYQPIGHQVSNIQVGNPLRGTRTHGHINSMTTTALRDLFTNHGFSVEQFIGIGFYPLPIMLANMITPLIRRFAVIQTWKVRPRS